MRKQIEQFLTKISQPLLSRTFLATIAFIHLSFQIFFLNKHSLVYKKSKFLYNYSNISELNGLWSFFSYAISLRWDIYKDKDLSTPALKDIDKLPINLQVYIQEIPSRIGLYKWGIYKSGAKSSEDVFSYSNKMLKLWLCTYTKSTDKLYLTVKASSWAHFERYKEYYPRVAKLYGLENEYNARVAEISCAE